MRESSGNSAAKADRTRRSPSRSPFDSRAKASISCAPRFLGSAESIPRSTAAARSNARVRTRAAARSRAMALAGGACPQAGPAAINQMATAAIPNAPLAKRLLGRPIVPPSDYFMRTRLFAASPFGERSLKK